VTAGAVTVRQTTAADFGAIRALTEAVYPGTPGWTDAQLASHLRVFPEGQFVAVEESTGRVVGMAASLIVWWNDYDMTTNWRDFTGGGMFTNHDPVKGRTLYGAEVMVHPGLQGSGVGTKLYDARRALTIRLGLLRIRAGARLRHYSRYAATMTAEEYVIKVVRGELRDPTLSFQLGRGFEVIAVVSNYLRHDPESLGHAAVIEWLNPAVATPEDYAARRAKYLRMKNEE
jgi:ribosomal protein S18 acetylase RimI-like enzyme